MEINRSWGEATLQSLQSAWAQILNGLPEFVTAIVILIVGLVVARFVGNLVRRAASGTRIDGALDNTGVPQRVRRAGIPFSLSGFIGGLAHWLIVLITLTSVADILRWAALTRFLQSVVAYIPHALVAIAILFVGFWAAGVLRRVAGGAVRASNMPERTEDLIGSLVQTAVVVFAFMAALTQLNVARELLLILFGGIVLALSLAFGLAFGLGGRDKASAVLGQLGPGARAAGGRMAGVMRSPVGSDR